jgi:hypothetical protein
MKTGRQEKVERRWLERSSEREEEGGGKGRVPTKMGGEGREEESWSGRESGSREKES